MGMNVFGNRSRYRTAVLDTSQTLPNLPPAEVLAPELIGTTIHINYPHLMEAFVTSLSTRTMTLRGEEPPRFHDQNESEV